MRYSEEVLSRVREPKRVGVIAEGSDVGTGVSGTLESGTVTRIQVRVIGERVVEARFKVFGCSAAIASASLVAELIEGAAKAEALALTPEQVVQQLRLAPEREYTARMAVEAAQLALRNAGGAGVKETK